MSLEQSTEVLDFKKQAEDSRKQAELFGKEAEEMRGKADDLTKKSKLSNLEANKLEEIASDLESQFGELQDIRDGKVKVEKVNPKSKRKTNVEERKPGRPKGSGHQNDKPLKEVVYLILKKQKTGFKLSDLSTAVTEYGYVSTAQDDPQKFAKIVYQAVNRLMNEKEVIRDDEHHYKIAA